MSREPTICQAQGQALRTLLERQDLCSKGAAVPVKEADDKQVSEILSGGDQFCKEKQEDLHSSSLSSFLLRLREPTQTSLRPHPTPKKGRGRYLLAGLEILTKFKEELNTQTSGNTRTGQALGPHSWLPRSLFSRRILTAYPQHLCFFDILCTLASIFFFPVNSVSHSM